MDFSYINTLNQQFKDINFLYSGLDEKEGIDYAEQYIGIHTLSKNKYVASIAIVDITALFDPKLNFVDNVKKTCALGAKRGKLCLKGERHSRKNHFLKAFSAGMRDLVDRFYRDNGNELPFLCFDTLIDLKKDGRGIFDRVTPLTVTQRPVDQSRRFSFKNFMDPDKAQINDVEKKLREEAKDFLEKIQEFPNLPQVSFCLEKGGHANKRPFGDKFNAAVSLAVKVAGAKSSLEKGIPLIARDSAASHIILGEKEGDKEYDCTDLTAPLRHPAAAYNIHQYKKIYKICTTEALKDRQCEGDRQARRVSAFFNEQARQYRFPFFQDSNYRFLQGTSLVSTSPSHLRYQP